MEMPEMVTTEKEPGRPDMQFIRAQSPRDGNTEVSFMH